MPGPLAKMKVLLILAESSWKTEIKLFPVVRYFTWKLELVSNILWVIVGQTVLPLGKNLLKILEKFNNESYVFFIKFDPIFLKGQYGSTCIFPDSDFSKDIWNRNKTQAFDRNL